MSFVNEKVSEQDIEKYGLREINKQFLKGDFEYDWTIDRERDVYLRIMGNNWQEPQEQKVSFYWKGHLLRFDLRMSTSGKNVRGGKGDCTWSLSSNNTLKTLWLPDDLEVHREEVTGDLKQALSAYKDFGRRSVIVDHTAYFQF